MKDLKKMQPHALFYTPSESSQDQSAGELNIFRKIDEPRCPVYFSTIYSDDLDFNPLIKCLKGYAIKAPELYHSTASDYCALDVLVKTKCSLDQQVDLCLLGFGPYVSQSNIKTKHISSSEAMYLHACGIMLDCEGCETFLKSLNDRWENFTPEQQKHAVVILEQMIQDNWITDPQDLNFTELKQKVVDVTEPSMLPHVKKVSGYYRAEAIDSKGNELSYESLNKKSVDEVFALFQEISHDVDTQWSPHHFANKNPLSVNAFNFMVLGLQNYILHHAQGKTVEESRGLIDQFEKKMLSLKDSGNCFLLNCVGSALTSAAINRLRDKEKKTFLQTNEDLFSPNNNFEQFRAHQNTSINKDGFIPSAHVFVIDLEFTNTVEKGSFELGFLVQKTSKAWGFDVKYRKNASTAQNLKRWRFPNKIDEKILYQQSLEVLPKK